MKKFFLYVVFSFFLISCQTTKDNLPAVSNANNSHVAKPNIFLEKNLENISFKRLYIELFSNNNHEAGLNARLRQKLVHQYSLDGRMSVQQSREHADIILSGTIESFALLPIAYDPRHEITRYQLNISVSLFLNAGMTKENNLKQQKYLQKLIEGERGSSHKMLYSSNSGGSASLEILKDQLLEGLSHRIVRATLDNWYPHKNSRTNNSLNN